MPRLYWGSPADIKRFEEAYSKHLEDEVGDKLFAKVRCDPNNLPCENGTDINALKAPLLSRSFFNAKTHHGRSRHAYPCS